MHRTEATVPDAIDSLRILVLRYLIVVRMSLRLGSARCPPEADRSADDIITS